MYVNLMYFVLLVGALGARDPPMVTIPGQGILLGTHISMFRTQRTVAYLGIPYAQPPVGELRFEPPSVSTLPSWSGIRNATQFTADCWQNPNRPLDKHDELFRTLLPSTGEPDRGFDEDCLYLNVYIPEGPPPVDRYAVMVWLHSGDFMRGSAALMDPFHLVFKQKLIVVTVAYRLNIFGFFTTMDGEAPGNFGLMDQSAALFWVQKNIELFNGNKEAVTLFGHGAGAISAQLHMTSGEWSHNTFNRVIAMSADLFAPDTVKSPVTASHVLDRIAYLFACYRTPTSQLVACLRNVQAASLLEQSELLSDWGPVMDAGLSNATTPFMADYPRMLFERGQFTKVPLLTGFTDMENALEIVSEEVSENGVSPTQFESMLTDVVLGDLQTDNNDSCPVNIQYVVDTVNFFFKPQIPVSDPVDLRKRFIDFATTKDYGASTYLMASLTSNFSAVYAYRFDLRPQTVATSLALPSWVGVPRRFDLVFVWGLPYWSSLPGGAQWESADKRVSDIVMTLWANFAKYANPTHLGVYIKWEPFTEAKPGLLIIDRSFNMSDELSVNYKSFEFWNYFYPKVIEMSTTCCNTSSSAPLATPTLYAIEHGAYILSAALMTFIILL